MKAVRPSIVIGLALTLLLPMGAVGQEESPPAGPSVEPSSAPSSQQRALPAEPSRRPPDAMRPGIAQLIDKAKDMRDAATGKKVEGPGYGNIRSLTAAADESDLRTRFDMLVPVPEIPYPLTTTVSYGVHIDTNDDGASDFDVLVQSADGWHADLVDTSTGSRAPLDAPVIKDGQLTATVPLSLLGWPRTMRVRGDARVTDMPGSTSEAGDVTAWEDQVPNDPSEYASTVRLSDGGKAVQYSKSLVGAKVDPKASLRRVRSLIDGLYKDKAAAERLEDLGAGSRHVNAKAMIARGTKMCASATFVDQVYGPCTTPVQSLIAMASQYPVDSKNKVDAKVGATLLKAAKVMRSAAINAGVPAREMDRAARHWAERWQKDCRKGTLYLSCPSDPQVHADRGSGNTQG